MLLYAWHTVVMLVMKHYFIMQNMIGAFHVCLQSQEGAALIDVQTTALFGNLRDLQVQMQKAVGQDATSVEELMQKVQVCYIFAFRFGCTHAPVRLGDA